MNDIIITINIQIIDMKDKNITRFYYDGRQYQLINNNNNNTNNNDVKIFDKIISKRYKNIIDKWLKKTNKTVFSVEDFKKDNPTQTSMKRINSNLCKMIEDHTITQLDNNRFRVNH